MILTFLLATYAGRVTSLSSTSPCRSDFTAERTLLYQRRISQDPSVMIFGALLEPRYIVGPEPLDQ
jgi:hypothetical protein